MNTINEQVALCETWLQANPRTFAEKMAYLSAIHNVGLDIPECVLLFDVLFPDVWERRL